MSAARISALSPTEFEESMHRLQAAGVLIAVRVNDGRGLVRIIQTDADAHQAVLDGLTLYTPEDMYAYLVLSEGERKMLHSFKHTFGGAIAWAGHQRSEPEEW